MIATLLILGRPGSGKTTAFRAIQSYLEKREWSVKRLRDYDILREMFQEEQQQLKHCYQCAHQQHCIKHQPRFRPTAHNGFDVTHLSALQDALAVLENHIKDYIAQLKTENSGNFLIAIEFARDIYNEITHTFLRPFLDPPHILFVDSQLEKCISRIEQRVHSCDDDDRHYVSSYIMHQYYHIDNRPYMCQQAHINTIALQNAQYYGPVVRFIENNSSRTLFSEAVEQFAQTILDVETRQPREAEFAENNTTHTNPAEEIERPMPSTLIDNEILRQQNQEKYNKPALLNRV